MAQQGQGQEQEQQQGRSLSGTRATFGGWSWSPPHSQMTTLLPTGAAVHTGATA